MGTLGDADDFTIFAVGQFQEQDLLEQSPDDVASIPCPNQLISTYYDSDRLWKNCKGEGRISV